MVNFSLDTIARRCFNVCINSVMRGFMKKYEDLEKHDFERDMFVVKSNALIQRSRYRLTNEEQRILLYLISKIRPDEKENRWHTINIIEYCKVAGINLKDVPAMYSYIKKTIKSLADKSFWISFDGRTEKLLRWIDKAEINKYIGDVSILLNDELMPYLLQLKSNYTQYRLLYTLTMKGKYSIRMYELFRSYLYADSKKTEKIFEIEAFMRRLGMEEKNMQTYLKNITMFKQKVLDKAIEEINERTDIKVKYELRKEKKRVTEIKFFISENEQAFDNTFNDYNILDAGLKE